MLGSASATDKMIACRLAFAFVLLALIDSITADEKKTIKVVTIEHTPFTEVNNGNVTGGFIPDLLEFLLSMHNYTVEFVLVKEYGVENNGDWSGLIGEVKKKQADLAAGAITVNEKRKAAVTFTKPFLKTKLALLKSVELKINNFTELANANETEIKYGFLKNGATHMFFKESKDATYKKIAEHAIELTNSAEGVKLAKEKKFVAIMEGLSADYYAAQYPCLLDTSGDLLDEREFAFATSKEDSKKLQELLDKELEKKETQEKILELKEKYWKTPSCPPPKSESIVLQSFVGSLIIACLSVLLLV